MSEQEDETRDRDAIDAVLHARPWHSLCNSYEGAPKARGAFMTIESFFDPATWTLTYLIWDPDTKDAVIIDPVLDFDPVAIQIDTHSATKIVDRVVELGLEVGLILDTHVHADHLSGSLHLKNVLGAPIGIGSQITQVQEVFKGIFGFDDTFATDGSQWDVLIEDGVPMKVGSLTLIPLHSPGHTPACYVYRIRDAVFTGDVMFMPDFGTGRCDFPGGSAADLYASIQRLYALPDATRVFVGHDYQPGGRALAFETTIAECKRDNIQLAENTSEASFFAFRTERDRGLAPPKLIFQSLQVNANGGRLPEPRPNGRRYLSLPMDVFRTD